MVIKWHGYVMSQENMGWSLQINMATFKSELRYLKVVFISDQTGLLTLRKLHILILTTKYGMLIYPLKCYESRHRWREPLPSLQQQLDPIATIEETGSLFLQNYLVPDDVGGFYALLPKKTENDFLIFHSTDGYSISLVTEIHLKGITNMIFTRNNIFLADRRNIYKLDIENNYSIDLVYQATYSNANLLIANDQEDVWLYEEMGDSKAQFLLWDERNSMFKQSSHSIDKTIGTYHKFKCGKNDFWLIGIKLLVRHSKDQMNRQSILRT